MPTTPCLRGRRPRPPAAFTMAEMLVVMAIITILAASLAVVLPKLRTMAMTSRAEADIRNMSVALDQYHTDIGHYPTAPRNLYMDNILRLALTNPKAGSPGTATQGYMGWGGANTEWPFIRKNNIGKYGVTHSNDCNNNGIWQFCCGKHQILDPWGVPYYYIAHSDYLRGVRHYEDPANQPIIYGATERPNDYRGDPGDTPIPADPDRTQPRKNYYGPPPRAEEFYNPQTYQIHSKGPDQATDIDDGDETNIDPCDRGTDGDDVNNYAK